MPWDAIVPEADENVPQNRLKLRKHHGNTKIVLDKMRPKKKNISPNVKNCFS